MSHVAVPRAPPETNAPPTIMTTLPPSTQTELEAYAFRQLVAHLRNRPDVSNIDQMNLAGFCRNCLSKWFLKGAREMGLDMRYDTALETVYGEPYGEWKGKHQRKATAEQMRLFEANAHLHAEHPIVPMVVGDKTDADAHAPPPKTQSSEAVNLTPPGVLSDVCCTPETEIGLTGVGNAVVASGVTNSTAGLMTTGQPAIDLTGNSTIALDSSSTQIRLGVLTISDRAFNGVYPDTSGPTIVDAMHRVFEKNIFSTLCYVAPDDFGAISQKIKQLVNAGCNVVFTTGGTGIDRRDVTPEATRGVLHREIPGIAQFLLTKSLGKEINQPHACLSRAVAGVRDRCLIINLPGRPSACSQLVNEIAPILPHALAQIRKGD